MKAGLSCWISTLRRMRRNNVAWLLLAGAALLILTGITQGQPAQVLAKAIRVCMECVGIG